MARPDLVVAYRIYPGVSRTPAIFADDKLRLAELCLASFQRGLQGVRARIVALLDNCPPAYEALFTSRFDDVELVRLPGIGNGPTFVRQLDVLGAVNDADAVYFAEDDFFYLPHSMRAMLDFLSQDGVDFVTGYDHLDYYRMPFHQLPATIRHDGQRHWRTAACTVLTFLTRPQTVRACRPVFDSYAAGALDASMWMALTKARVFDIPFSWTSRRQQSFEYVMVKDAWQRLPWSILFGPRRRLWAPMPSLATHVESPFLAPGIDWATHFGSG